MRKLSEKGDESPSDSYREEKRRNSRESTRDDLPNKMGREILRREANIAKLFIILAHVAQRNQNQQPNQIDTLIVKPAGACAAISFEDSLLSLDTRSFDDIFLRRCKIARIGSRTHS